jgi:hypothetical protein
MQRMRSKSTVSDRERLAQRVRVWVSSPEGQQSLAQTQQSVRDIVASAERDAQINQVLLRTPVTL